MVRLLFVALLLTLLASGCIHPAKCHGAQPQSTLPPLPQTTLAPVRTCLACRCPCGSGAACTCAAGNCNCGDCPGLMAWFADSDGTADRGLWRGQTFVGRWFAATGEYRAWDGHKHGRADFLPAGAPPLVNAGTRYDCNGTTCRPYPVYAQAAPPAAHPVDDFRYWQAAYPAPAYVFGGGCPGGNCGGR